MFLEILSITCAILQKHAALPNTSVYTEQRNKNVTVHLMPAFDFLALWDVTDIFWFKTYQGSISILEICTSAHFCTRPRTMTGISVYPGKQYIALLQGCRWNTDKWYVIRALVYFQRRDLVRFAWVLNGCIACSGPVLSHHVQLLLDQRV